MTEPIVVQVEIKGLDKLRARFDQGSKIVKHEADLALENIASALHRGVANYTMFSPAPGPKGTYVREFKLKQSWMHKVYRGRYEAVVGSNIEYAPYVLDDQRQAAVHRGRWYTVQSKADELAPMFDRYLDVAADRIVNKLAGP